MAQLQAMGDVLRAKVEGDPAPPPPDQRDQRPLAEAIVGRWSNGMITFEFHRDGTGALVLPGGNRREGPWSVEGGGKLISDVTGPGDGAETWVVGDSLTISSGGQALKFSRQ